ncbi:TonB-dependent receptor [Pedobacter nyackensis]|uniref:TonB-linked outer membrane protein, SusC/RagA family n=1 Tax=Pedobacter nyackensis TaxID=475255 RepID=A0A1W2C9M3_9SPHI|nr:TonB-dependent receptor [Pedobacter nyackensis]SMC81977.1 TonB-linked outer membrane protein, SusC/RagA family [Pedobacter nyackensis]
MSQKTNQKRNYHLQSRNGKKPFSLFFATLKIVTLLTVFISTFANAKTFSQTIKLHLKSAKIADVLIAIEKQSDYTFFYKTEDLKGIKKVDVNINENSINTVLQQLLEGLPLEYSIEGKTIAVNKTLDKPSGVKVVLAEKIGIQQSITGTVKDVSGMGIPGASVTVKGTSRVTSTNSLGQFSIEANIGDILIISSIGFTSQEVKITSPSLGNIILSESLETLSELVVVGYSVQKKESLTGALSTISGDKLKNVTSPNVQNMLAGKAPGLFVAPGSGKPGTAGSVVIRGQATLSGTTSPLWVIDGVIVGSSPGEINPEDIESMTVLKDAASTAIYGSQGANGVIVVTTKRAKSGEMTVDISSRSGFTQLTNGNLQVMNGAELYDYYASFTNASAINFPRWNPELRNSNFDWWNLATKSGFNQNHNISLQGGTEKLQSYLSVGYYDESGAIKGYDYERYNFRLNTVYKPFDWLTVKPSLVGSRRAVTDRQYDVTSMYSNLPWDSPYDADGNLVPHRSSLWVNNASTNYLYDLQWNKSANTNYEFMGNLDFDIKLTKNFTFSSVNNYRFNTYAASGYIDPRSNGGESVNGRVTDYRSEYTRRYTNQLLRYNNTWGKHSLSALAGYEFNDYYSKTLDVYGTGIVRDFEVLDVVAKPERTRGAINEWAVQSLLFNSNYSYDGKYLAQVSLRRDGASNFGKKYGNFFSISGGWNINREEWFKADYINTLKLRAAYGTVGNRPSSLYPQYDLYAVNPAASYDGIPGLLISQIGNKNLTWEETYTSGLGLDATAFDNRVRLNLDYYIKSTDNILFNVPISGLTGVTRLWQNVGKMKNKGIEIALGGDIIRTNDLTWSLDVNMGHNVNKLTDIYKTRNSDGTYSAKQVIIGDDLGIAGSASRILQIGLPVDTYYMPEWAGVNPDDGKPMWYKVTRDANGNEIERTKTSTYAQASQEKLDKASPDVFGGITTALTWKKFDLNAVFGYSFGGKVYNYSRQEYDADGTYTDRNQMRLQDGWSRWQKPGDIATHPVARYNNQDKGNSVSSRYIESNDFFRMRSLAIGYNFDLKKYKVRNLRAYLSGENLFVITKYSGVDPEIPVNEENQAILFSAGPAVYPMARKFMLGLNVSF